MKPLILGSTFVVLALMLSSCGLHTGLGKLFGLGGSNATNSTAAASTSATKRAKATHAPPSPATQADSVVVTSSGFQPATLTIKVGATVVWTNKDAVAQSITSDAANLFDSGSLNTGATFKYTFAQAGTFTYHSASTPAATGTIVVTP